MMKYETRFKKLKTQTKYVKQWFLRPGTKSRTGVQLSWSEFRGNSDRTGEVLKNSWRTRQMPGRQGPCRHESRW
jgi:hypothetical protein